MPKKKRGRKKKDPELQKFVRRVREGDIPETQFAGVSTTLTSGGSIDDLTRGEQREAYRSWKERQKSGGLADVAADVAKFTPASAIPEIAKGNVVTGAARLIPGTAAGIETAKGAAKLAGEVAQPLNVTEHWNNGPGKLFNPVVRSGFAAAQFPVEAVQGFVRAKAQQVAEDPGSLLSVDYGEYTEEGTAKKASEQTLAGQAISRKVAGKDSGLGGGLLPSQPEPVAGEMTEQQIKGILRSDDPAAILKAAPGLTRDEARRIAESGPEESFKILSKATKPGAEAAEAQAEAAREYSPYLIGGHAWTPGRAITAAPPFNLITEPDDQLFNQISGLIDASYTIAADPTLYTGTAVAQARRAAKGVRAETAIGESVEKGFRSKQGKEILDWLSRTKTADEVQARFPEWSRGLSERIASTTDPDRIRAVTKAELPHSDLITPRSGPLAPAVKGAELGPEDVTRAMRGEVEPAAKGAGPTLGPPTPTITEAFASPAEQADLLREVGLNYGVRKYVHGGLTAVERLATRGYDKARGRIMEAGGSPYKVRHVLGESWSRNLDDYDEIAQAAAAGDTAAVDNAIWKQMGLSQQQPKFGAGYKWRRTRSRHPGLERTFGMTPNGTYDPADPAGFLQQAEREAINMKMPFEKRAAIFDDLMRVPRAKAAQAGTREQLRVWGRAQLQHYGVPEKEADNLVRYSLDQEHQARMYVASQVADSDGQYFDNMVDIDGKPVNFEKNPLWLSQLLGRKTGGLDYREIRRNTSAFKPFFDLGLVKAGTALGDTYMSMWKLGKIYRAALGVRVVMDEQLRMAAAGLNSFGNHPMKAISWVVGHPQSRTASFLKRVPGGKKAGAALEKLETKVGKGAEGVGGPFIAGHGPFGASPGPLADPEFTQVFQNRFAAMHGPRVQQRYMDEFWKVGRGDPMAARGLVEDLARAGDGLNRRVLNEGVDSTKEWFWADPDGARLRQEVALDSQFTNIADDKAASDAYIMALDDSLRKNVTNGDRRLLDAIHTGRLDNEPLLGANGTNDRAVAKAQSILDEGAGPDFVTVQKQHVDRLGSRERGVEMAKNATDWLFSELMPKPSDYLSRSTTFRQVYWKRVDDLMPYVAPGERQKVLDQAKAAHLNKKWIGESDYDRLVEKSTYTLREGDPRTLTAKQLDQAAKGHALDETKNLLWDLSERSQFFDASRLIFPFGEAWKEVLTRWSRLTWNDPTILRKAQIGIEGARDAAIFQKNSFGEESVMIPGSEFISEQLTGVPMPLGMSVAGMNLISSGTPGVGPLAQVAVSKMLDDKPEWDWVKEKVFQFGEPEQTGDPVYDGLNYLDPLPSFTRRIRAAFSDPAKSREYAGTIGWVMRYNMSTGKYGKSPEEQQRLLKDSKEQAKNLLLLRGVAQTVAPSAPYPEWKVVDKDGKKKDGRKLLEEWGELAYNTPGMTYDEAYKEFTKRHGESNMMLTQAFTESVEGFAPTTKSGSQWIEANKAIRDKYPKVYGLFAPSDGEFDIDAWQNQLSTGDRKHLEPEEVLRQTNSRHASFIYRRQRDQAKEKGLSSKATTKYLNDLKDWLSETYVGYDPDDFERDSNIRDLKFAVNDADVAKASPRITAATKKYFDARSQALERAEGSSLGGEDDKPLRHFLRDYADWLSRRYKGFGRVFDSVFESETRE